MKKVRLIVSGRVQGVGFRYSTYAIALQIGDIYGRVWNNDDGTVEILAQSQDAAKMAKFIQEVRKSSMHRRYYEEMGIKKACLSKCANTY